MQKRPLALSLAAAGFLSACGGGGSSDNKTSPSVTGVTLAGVVAGGAAWSGATVTATCATGSGTATAAANGGYSIAVTTGSLPCVLEAVSSDQLTKLHSVAPTTPSGSATANITPLTELVVARLTAADPAQFALVPGNLTSMATASAVSAAQSAVASTLTAGGLDTASAGDFMAGTLVAANGSTAGNAYDALLDRLKTQLASSGTTLTTLAKTIAAAAGGSSGATITDNKPGLPPELLLKPKAANCASLASGAYRVIKFAPSGGNTVSAVGLINFDASTLTQSDPGSADSSTWTANGNCRYSTPDGADVVVSPAGVLVARAKIGMNDTSVAPAARGTTRMVIAFPVQNIAPAELAGSWNFGGWNAGAQPSLYDIASEIGTIASSGAVTQFKCGGAPLSTPESSCPVYTTLLPVISANSAGGFDITGTDPADRYVDRGFAYRAGNGDLMLVALSASGGLTFGTKVRTLALPLAGDVTPTWHIDVGVAALANASLYSRTRTILSVDPASSTVFRNSANNGSSVTYPETVQYNGGRNGTTYRQAASVTASDGTTVQVREAFSLPLLGFGVTPYYLPPTSGSGAASNALFGVAVVMQP